MSNKGNSPFTPGSPVPVELFVGRERQIRELIRYAGQVSSGDRGIGKSSLASFLHNILGIHVFR